YGSGGGWLFNARLEYLSLIGAATLTLGVLLCSKRAPGRQLRIFGACWWLIGFLPISNLFPLNAQVAEHWIYMPSVGLLLFLAGCSMGCAARPSRLVQCLVVSLVIGFGIRTTVRSFDWVDGETFYKRTIEAGG